uniref:Uncharacterized protein n=1 Tax=Rhizophora mucronata TaxID=61149 RepID=A0A2P2IJ78_RHIMU
MTTSQISCTFYLYNRNHNKWLCSRTLKQIYSKFWGLFKLYYEIPCAAY